MVLFAFDLMAGGRKMVSLGCILIPVVGVECLRVEVEALRGLEFHVEGWTWFLCISLESRIRSPELHPCVSITMVSEQGKRLRTPIVALEFVESIKSFSP